MQSTGECISSAGLLCACCVGVTCSHVGYGVASCSQGHISQANPQPLPLPAAGSAVREGASRGLVLQPVFSLYSYHGPVFRWGCSRCGTAGISPAVVVMAHNVCSYLHAPTLQWRSRSAAGSLHSHTHGVCYGPHRCMLRVTRGHVWPERHYKFAGHCHVHGNVRPVAWQDLSEAWCRWGAGQAV